MFLNSSMYFGTKQGNPNCFVFFASKTGSVHCLIRRPVVPYSCSCSYCLVMLTVKSPLLNFTKTSFN